MFQRSTRLNSLTARLRERGHRLTPQRLAILKILSDNTEHLSAEQIYARVSEDFPTTSLATVYKTISTLKEMGEVMELGFGDSGNRYDVRDPLPHPHLICVNCKKIIDVEIGRLDELTRPVALKTGYQILHHRLDFFGLCPECQEKAQDH